MPLLFDIGEYSPEDHRKKKARKKLARAPDVVMENEVQPPPPPFRTSYVGRVSDSGSPCPYCEADEWDVDDDFGRQLAVTCAFCSKIWSIERPKSFSSSQIRSGQLAGLTVSEALAAGGSARKILDFMAKSDPELAAELARSSCRPAV